VAGLARLTDRFDREIINQLASRVGLASLAAAEELKLGVSGQLQSYVLTVVVAIVVLFASLTWLQGG
jgi:NAD(P)H-quinone oxidoreductase subunit 5